MKEVAVGILRQNGLVLACQRKNTALYPLQWEFPGGKLETSETPVEALVRELKEELGITVVPTSEFQRQVWNYGDASYRVFYFIVDSFNGTIENRAFEQIKWVTPGELMQMNILEGNRDVVEALARGVQ